MVLPKLTFVLLCAPFFSLLPRWWWFAVALCCGFSMIAEMFIMLSFCLKHTENFRLHWKQSAIVLLLWFIDRRGVCCHAWICCISIYVVARRDFSCYSLSLTTWNGANIQEYEAHWHMNFSFINGCGTHKNNIHNHSLFWSGAYELRNVIIATKISKQTSIRKNL